MHFKCIEEQRGRGSKFKRRSHKSKGENFYVGVDPSAILSELPTSTSFGVMRVLYVLNNIPPH